MWLIKACLNNLIETSYFQILKSPEGQHLRKLHQENVSYLRNLLTRARLPQMPSQSHIIPIPVGDPVVCAWLCDELMKRYHHYVQSINYPTVPKGKERLRIAPTPSHTREMMHDFVLDLLKVWNEAGLPLIDQAETCSICQKSYELRMTNECDKNEACPQYTAVH